MTKPTGAGRDWKARCTSEEFKDLWDQTRGSAAEIARILKTSERAIHARRRSIENREGRPLLSRQPNSPDYPSLAPEFPDWQTLEIKNGLLVCISDGHFVPHIKSTAHRAALKLIAELKPKAIIDMGDMADFASISRHHRIGWDKQLPVREEISWWRDCMDEFREAGGKGCKTLKCQSNHEQRFSGHLSNAANAMAYEGVRGFSLSDHLEGWPLSWAVRVNDDQLEVTHRWKSAIHAPWLNTMNAGISYATGHLHSQKIYPLTDLRGDRWGVDVGTLSTIYGPHFRYMEAKPRSWRSGFAVFRFVDYKLRQPQLVRVVDEKKGIVEYLDRDIAA
mgnify:CR=1 FL=1